MKKEKKSKISLGRSDLTEVFIKKLVYIRFYKLVTSYDLAPGAARYLKGYRHYGSRKVWDVQSRTDFIRPPRPTKFYVVNERLRHCGRFDPFWPIVRSLELRYGQKRVLGFYSIRVTIKITGWAWRQIVACHQLIKPYIYQLFDKHIG